MRRAALPTIGILGVAGIAAAEPWSVRMESGGEADTNVARVETAIGTPPRIAAGAGRIGARIDYRGSALGGAYVMGVAGLARMIASANDDIKDENVMLYTGDLRWLRPIGARSGEGSIAAGAHLTAADSFGTLGGTGARTFRNLGGDALIVLGRDDDHLTLGLGGRDFVYKPIPDNSQPHMFDWRGPVANAQFDSPLWHAADRTQNLELTATLGVEQRTYAATAIANCAPHGMVVDPCRAPTLLRRRDRYQRAGVDLTWTGGLVATGSYQVTLIDSNSYGQSLFRQRITAQVTMELLGKLFGTAAATLQLDQYPDGVPIVQDVQRQTLTTLDDENRSSLQVLITREVSAAWTVELRGAVWRDFASTAAATFRRTLLYAGVIYAR